MKEIVLVDFFIKGCEACAAQDPILEELRKDIGDEIEIIKVNVAENRDVIRELDIDATPTLFMMKDNNIFRKYIGLTKKNELESDIYDALGYL